MIAPAGVRDVDELRDLFAAVDLQWFAAEDEGRTEDPTEHKLEKSREEGKVAKSADVSGALVLLFSIVAIALLGSYLFDTFGSMVRFYYSRATEIDITTSGVAAEAFYRYFVRLMLPVASVAFIAALAGNIVQVGFLFTTKTITPDLNRIVPKFGKYIQRSLFGVEAIYNLFKAMGKVIIIALVAFLNIQAGLAGLTATVEGPFAAGVQRVASLAMSILLQVAAILLFLSIFDYLFQRRRHIEELKMTKQEIKEERKTYEGDPLVKSRLKRRMQELLSQNQIQKVPEADVVVTNPTHFAVALQYDREKMEAPSVIAKGQDIIAQRIKEVAREHNVPVVENKPLARALHAEVEIGDPVPEMYYRAVATILAHVYRMRQAG